MPQLLAAPALAQVGAGDFNGNGRPDVIAIGRNTGLHLFLNQSRAIGTLSTVSAASFSTSGLAPEQIVASFGAALATETALARTNPLPTTLGGTQVRVRDSAGIERLAQLFYVSPGQVNFLMPSALAYGTATIQITNSNGAISAHTVNIIPSAPGLFSLAGNGQGLAAAQVLRVGSDNVFRYEPVARLNANSQWEAIPIDLSNGNEEFFLVAYGTGMRRRATNLPSTSTIGGVSAEVLYAGMQGSLAGLDQVNIRLPRTLSGRGNVAVILTVDGKVTNTVSINVK
jgi:uncharacterized protein (TIGR03437 family)